MLPHPARDGNVPMHAVPAAAGQGLPASRKPLGAQLTPATAPS